MSSSDEKSTRHVKDKRIKEKSRRSDEKDKSTSSDTDDSQEIWMEANNPKRDSWMNDSFDAITSSSKDYRKLKEDKHKERQKKSLATVDKPGQHERELNPYWKSGGTGLPSKESAAPSVSGHGVSDGGLNWLRKAYQRVAEQAKEEGRSMESVAAERWGSLENLEAMLEEAKEKNRKILNSPIGAKAEHKRYEKRFAKPIDDYKSRSRKDRRSDTDRERRSTPDWKKGEEYSRSSHKSRHERISSSRPRWRKHSPEDDRRSPKKDNFRKPETRNESQDLKRSDAEDKADGAGLEKIVTPSLETLNSSTLRVMENVPSVSAVVKEEPKVLTEKEMNELGAKILKAELIGNTKLAEALKLQMESARNASKMDFLPSTSQNQESREEVVVLTKTNRYGMSRPFSKSELGDESSSSKSKKIKVATHDAGGQRVRYFHDDENYSINEMFLKEKFTTSEDETALFLKMAAKAKGKTDSDYEVDDIFVDYAAKGGSNSKNVDQERQNAIRDHKRFAAEQENCRYCLEGKSLQKHLIIATGIRTYLMVPGQQSLTDGHCLIVPMDHIRSATLLDEDVWSEIQIFRKGLTKMFEAQGKDTVFMETSLNSKYHRHMFVECIPVDQEVGYMAPMYFKKAILECDTEWADNKKLVDLSKKDIRHSVPKGFPYFSVDFGLQGGFAHVVEDNAKFPWYFGKEVVGGLVNAEPRLWLKPVRESFTDQSKKVLEFENLWKPFDWTYRLKNDN